MKVLFVFVLCITEISLLYGSQSDSTSTGVLNNFYFNISATHISHFGLSGNDEAVVPKYFVENNKPTWVEVTGNAGDPNEYLVNLTDNPLQHGPAFIDCKLGFQTHGFSVNTDIVAEHRGISYGVYNTKAMIIYPKYMIAYDSSFSLFQERISAGAFVGNYTGLRLYEGLVTDNIDGQGMQVYMKWKKVKFCINAVGDLVNWIGLNLDASFNFMLTFEDINIDDDLYLESTLGGFDYMTAYGNSDEYNNTDNTGFDISVSVMNYASPDSHSPDKKPDDYMHYKVYTEFANRSSQKTDDFKSSSSFLAGVSAQYSCKGFDIDFLGEYRFYGYAFNAGFLDRSVSYRRTVTLYDTLGTPLQFNDEEYNNTIGDNLYPLSFYDRPFSQWAVYTRYENLDVTGWIFRTKMKYLIFDNLFADCDLDFNYIIAGSEPGFLYPFYTFGIGVGSWKENYISINLTNKSMNLDVNYPTFYVCTSPVLMLKFCANADVIGKMAAIK